MNRFPFADAVRRVPDDSEMDRIPLATLRRIAVKARCCEETIVRVWKGRPTRGDSARRAALELKRLGFKPPPLVSAGNGRPSKGSN